MGHDWCLGTLDVNQFGFAESHCAIDQPRGGLAEHYTARWSYRLHPLSHSDLLTDRGVTERTRTDLTDDHLTGIKSHPQQQLHTVAVMKVDRKPLRLLLKAQCSHARACCVILQRHRRTKHRHDPVTGEFVHRAAVALHHRCALVGEVGHDLAQPLCTDSRCDGH